MDNLTLGNLKGAVYGFLSSVSQTGSDIGSSIAHIGDSLTDKLPSQLSQVLPLRKAAPPPSRLSVVTDWVLEHKKLVSATVFGSLAASVAGFYYYGGGPLGARTGPFYYYTRGAAAARKDRRKNGRRGAHRRLAKRAENGGRSEVVLLVGSPNEPLVRLIAQDLNIRGFIVYITATPSEEEALAREITANEDIRCLKLDSYFEPAAVRAAVAHLGQVLATPVRAFPGAEPHLLSLAGITIIPDLFYPVGPLEATAAPQWTQTLQSKLQMPLNFLVLGGLDLARKHSSRFVLLTPVIMGSLSPAFHTAESLVFGALSALALSLSRELEPQGVPFTHLRLGSFDTRPLKLRSPSPPKHNVALPRHRVQADILGWPEDLRRLYGGRYRAAAASWGADRVGSNLRDLYHALYDTLTASAPHRVVRVGQGSRVYDWIRAWVPERALTMLLATNKQIASG